MNIKILFVCGRNKRRSRTAEKIFQNDQGCIAKSAGFSNSSPVKLTKNLVLWADLILVMEYKHSKRIKELFHEIDFPPIGVLNISDDYEFMDEELIKLLKSSTKEMLEKYG